MPSISDYSPAQKLITLHLSDSGSGKSAAAASYPRPFEQFDLDGRFDGVWAAVKPQGFLESDNITFTRYYTRNGYEPIQKKFLEMEQAMVAGRFPYKTIEIASVTTLVQALINSSHKAQSGNMVAGLRMSGPADFNFEVTGLKQVIDFLHILPCNVIISGHIIEKWGKPKGPKGSEYAPNVVTGEKISLRDQTGAFLASCFSNVFLFSREVVNGKMHYYVDFASDLAKNIFGIPPGIHDITGVPFYPYLMKVIGEIRNGTFEPPKQTNNLGMFG